jgi:hypothetical protein
VALPGLGLTTATENVPADAALPVALSCVDETKLVVSAEPASVTCAPLTNPLPFNVIAKFPAGTDAGEMLAKTGAGFQSVTVLLPIAVASAELTAFTATVLELGTLLGAVYIPDDVISPVAALPPVTPFTCQVTVVLDDPLTVALKG